MDFMGQTTLKFNKKTEDVITQLKEHYGATSKAEVMRKALALLELVRQAEERGGSIAIVAPSGQVDHKVTVR